MHRKVLKRLNAVLNSLERSRSKLAQSRYNAIEASLRRHIRTAKKAKRR